MSKRRANGEGSIYKRKSDNRWTGKIQVGNSPDGSPKYKIVYDNSQKEVKDKLDELKGNVKNNLFVENNKMTLGEFLDIYLNDIVRTSIRVSTWSIYENLIRSHIKPSIGGIKLQQLQLLNVQRLINEKTEGGRADGKPGGLSPKTLKHMRQVLNGALSFAKKQGYIAQNFISDVRIPKIPAKEMQTLTIDEVKLFLATARNGIYYKRYYAAYVLELYTGIRRGELLGIRWKDIDFKEQKNKRSTSYSRLP